LETVELFSPSAMQFLCDATCAAFRQPEYQRPTFLSNLLHQLAVVQCRYLSLLTAAAGLHTSPAGSGGIRSTAQAAPEVPQ
jgi:hypothetical protein